METKKISPLTLGLSLGVLLITYYPLYLAFRPHLTKYQSLGLCLFIQVAVILMLVRFLEQGLAPIGLSVKTLFHGIKRGAVWSLIFAYIALAMYVLLKTQGTDPFTLIRAGLPDDPRERMAFFIAGGLIAPVAEEIFFRGILFGYVRRWGFFTALFLSTAVFVAVHAPSGIPVTQAVGGLVFAVSYELEKSLWTPIIIHSTGNMALFACSLL